MKPGTFTQMYVQLVFAVKNRDAVLKKDIPGTCIRIHERNNYQSET